jgi:hypothetical protein
MINPYEGLTPQELAEKVRDEIAEHGIKATDLTGPEPVDVSVPPDLTKVSLVRLDAMLLEARKAATTAWPYAGTNDRVRAIEAEIRVRGASLPEER